MTTATIADTAVERRTTRGSSSTRRSGPRTWRPSSPSENGIDDLTDRHWQVIRFMRSAYLENGTGPIVRALGKTSGVSIKELYQLFPRARRSSPPRSPASPSRAAASDRRTP